MTEDQKDIVPKTSSLAIKDSETSSTSLWAKVFTSPFFWIVFAIIALISIINYLERFTNVQVHNQYQIF